MNDVENLLLAPAAGWQIYKDFEGMMEGLSV